MSLILVNPSLKELRLISRFYINEDELDNTLLDISKVGITKGALLVKSKDIK